MVTVTQILLLMVRNKATYDKLIPAVQHMFAISDFKCTSGRVFRHGGIVLCLNSASVCAKLLHVGYSYFETWDVGLCSRVIC